MFQIGFLGLFAAIASPLAGTPHLPQNATEWGVILALALVCSCFGFTFQPVAQRYTTADRAAQMCAINPLAAAVMSAIFLQERMGVQGVIGAALILLGIVQPVAYFIFENYGILYTSAAVAGTIIAAVPVCCILMDVLVLHERVTRRQVLCALGAIGGVALISVGGAVMISALGLLFLLLTMLSDTVYYGLSHDAAKRFTPFEITYVMFVVGMAVFIPVALIQAGGISSELITAPAQSGSFWLAVLYLGILSSGVAYGLLNFANSHLTVSESSLFSNVTTVVSVLAGVLFLKEDFSLWQALGVVIILVCVFVANVSGGEKK